MTLVIKTAPAQVSESNDFSGYVKSTVVDLSTPTDCLLAYLVRCDTDAPGMWRLAAVAAPTGDLIAIMNDTISTLIFQYGGGLEYPIPDPNKWGCESAIGMAWVASYLRGTEKTAEAWTPGVTDFAALLANNSYFLLAALENLRKVDPNASQAGLKIYPLLPGIVNDVLGGTYIPPAMPSGCGVSKVSSGADNPIPADRMDALLVGYSTGSAEEGMGTGTKVVIGVAVAAAAAVGIGWLATRKG